MPVDEDHSDHEDRHSEHTDHDNDPENDREAPPPDNDDGKSPFLVHSKWMGKTGLELLIGSVLGLLSCLMQGHGFDLPVRRIFSPKELFRMRV